jgi:hypothetical protein
VEGGQVLCVCLCVSVSVCLCVCAYCMGSRIAQLAQSVSDEEGIEPMSWLHAHTSQEVLLYEIQVI